jgi:hypothetical protein
MYQHTSYKRTRAADLSHGLDLAFSTTMVATFGGILAGAWLWRQGARGPELLVCACLGAIVCGLVGLAAKGAAENVHRGAIARIYAQALQGFRDPSLERRADVQPSATQTLNDLASGLVASVRLAFARRDELTKWAIAMNDQLALRKAVAAQMEAALSSDTHLITDATTAVRMADVRLAGQIQATKVAVERAVDAAFHLGRALELSHGGAQPASTDPPVQAAIAMLQYRLSEAQRQTHSLTPPAMSRMDSASEVRKAVERLGSYSEAMGEIMRGLPELATLG